MSFSTNLQNAGPFENVVFVNWSEVTAKVNGTERTTACVVAFIFVQKVFQQTRSFSENARMCVEAMIERDAIFGGG